MILYENHENIVIFIYGSPIQDSSELPNPKTTTHYKVLHTLYICQKTTILTM